MESTFNKIITDSNSNLESYKKINRIKDFLILDDAEIYYEIIGNGPPLIFIHGLGGNHLSWWQQIPFFVERFTCVTFSHRGFSLSKNHSNKYGARIFADDLSALIDHLQLKEVNLVAQSMGGWTALNYTLRNCSNVRSLIMASTTGELNYKSIYHSEIRKLKEWEDYSEKVKAELELHGILASTGTRMAIEQPGMSYLYKQIYDLTPNEYKNIIRHEIRTSRILSPDNFTKLTVPLFFIAGEEDVLFPPLAAKAAVSLLKNSDYSCVPKSGHSVYFERPDIFNRLVDKYLKLVYDKNDL
jgi:pimeloyl-ACP methyl ester carboxylesterase